MIDEESWIGKLCLCVEMVGIFGVTFGVVAILISIAKWIWCL